MVVDFSQFSANQIYHIMTQTIIPRPIAWVLTESDKDNYNLAPFSYFTAISSNPPLLMISAGKKPDGSRKDTVVNAEKNKSLVIHIADQALADVVTKTAETLEHGESEVSKNNLLTVPFDESSGSDELPRLKDCSIAFSCSVYEIQEIGDAPQTLIFAKVEKAFFSPEIATEQDNGRLVIDAAQANPLARLGGGEYAGITQPFKIDRPK